MQNKRQFNKPNRPEETDGIIFKTKLEGPLKLTKWQLKLGLISKNFDKFQNGEKDFFRKEFDKIDGWVKNA